MTVIICTSLSKELEEREVETNVSKQTAKAKKKEGSLKRSYLRCTKEKGCRLGICRVGLEAVVTMSICTLKCCIYFLLPAVEPRQDKTRLHTSAVPSRRVELALHQFTSPHPVQLLKVPGAPAYIGSVVGFLLPYCRRGYIRRPHGGPGLSSGREEATSPSCPLRAPDPSWRRSCR